MFFSGVPACDIGLALRFVGYVDIPLFGLFHFCFFILFLFSGWNWIVYIPDSVNGIKLSLELVRKRFVVISVSVFRCNSIKLCYMPFLSVNNKGILAMYF